MNRLPAFILAGGRSSRFGSDKARALVHGLPLILHVARSLEPLAASLAVVAEAPDKYKDLGLRTIADGLPGLGPLGGILTALDAVADEGWVLVSSCDAVLPPIEDLSRLMAAAGRNHDAAAFRGPEGWQPFPLLVNATSWDVAEDLLDRKKASLRGFLDLVDTESVSMPAQWGGALGINRPQDLASIRPGALGP